MILTREQVNELEKLAKPLMKFLCDNCNPHAKIIIECDRAEILSGSASVMTDEFMRD